MKISYNWLKEYIDFDLSPEKLAEILTSTGLEVGGVEKVESIRGGLKGVIAGEVLTCEKHPNADRLSLCSVAVGGEEDLQIVCGAPNVAKGQKVWVATVGTTLYPTGSDEPFTIGKAKVRGEVSKGMICAEDELGLGTDHDGIMVLSDNVAAGTLASEYYEVSEDFALDIDLTPNRSDATSHIGVAKDLAAYLSVNGKEDVTVKLPATEISLPDEGHVYPVEVLDSEACPRYAGVIIEGIQIGESPSWIKEKLQTVGVRPINNVVDITNFILHEMGQPLHAFDADKIDGGGIIVKPLDAGTKFVTLDEVERTLTGQDLMICDANGKGMCIGGVFGGIGTGVTESTTRIFLESAHFNPEWIRQTSMHHLLRTDAARTFEKATDPNICVVALKRAAALIAEVANGSVASTIVDIYPNPILPQQVKVKWEQVHKLIGIELSKQKVLDVLRAQSMEIVEKNETDFTVAVPTDKADVTREADVIEEILRIYGYDNVPFTHKMEVGLTAVSEVTPSQVRNILGSFLAAQGWSEMMGLSLTEDDNIDKSVLGIEAEARVMIENTSNINLNTMRPDLLVSALEAIRYNQNRNQDSLRLFEFGNGYKLNNGSPAETEYLSLVYTGEENPTNWLSEKSGESGFYTLKKYVDAIASRCGVKKKRAKEITDNRFAFGLNYSLGQDVLVSFGQVAPAIAKAMDIRLDVFVAQFDFGLLCSSLRDQKMITREISKYPATSRDLAFVFSEAVTYEKLEKLVKTEAQHMLSSLELFDVYRDDKNLGKGLKSYAIQMVFEDASKTLNDKEVDKVVSRIVGKVERELEGKLRG